MTGASLDKFITHMNRIAQPVLDRLDGQTELTNALAKNPRGLAAPLIAHCLKESSNKILSTDLLTPKPVSDKPVGIEDVVLWWGLLDETYREPGLSYIDMYAQGSLFDANIGKTYATIEVWTETELAGLHALSHYVSLSTPEKADLIRKRIQSVVQWHIENTQPDNATCHPWAAHVFLLHATPDAQHFAETMLSNCLVLRAEPDDLSAWILKDSAAALSAYIRL